MVRPTTIALLAIVLGLVACDDCKETPTGPESLHLGRVSGNNQQGLTGRALADSLVVAVTDDGGQAVAGQRVDFSVVAGDATVEPEMDFTDSSGYAWTRLTLGTSAAPVRVSATAYGYGDTVAFTATVESLTEATVQVGEVVLSAAAVQVGGDESELTYQSISGEQVTLSVSDQAPEVQVDDILVNTEEPYFLRKVVRVVRQTSGEVVVETEQATLTEVVKQASIHETFRLPASGKPAAPSRIQGGYVTLDNTTVAATAGVTAQVTAGSIAFDPEYAFDLEIDEWALEEFLLSAGGELTASLELRVEASAAASVSHKITVPPGGLPSHHVVFWAGWVPVVVGIQPVFNVGVEVSSAVEGSLTADASVEKEVRIGVHYVNASWHQLTGADAVWEVGTPIIDFRGDAEVRGFVEAQVNFELYDVAGPHVGVQPYLALGVEAQPQTADWVLEAGVDAYVGAHIEVLDNVIAGYRQSYNWARIELAQGSIDLGGDTGSVLVPDLVVDGLLVDPAAPTAAQTVTITVRAANEGTAAAEQVMVVLLVDGAGLDSTAVDLAAGIEAEIEFSPTQLAAGSHSLEVVARHEAGETDTLDNRTTGTLSVTDVSPPSASLVFIFDLSGSMNDPAPDGSGSLLAVAKQALGQVLESAAASGTREYALVTFGGNCTVSVPVPFTTEPQAVVMQARSLSADGSTPLAQALREAQHLALDEGSSDDVQLVLLSDGEETCGGDPLGVAQAIGTGVRAKPLARVVRLNAIGLGLEPGGDDEHQIQAIAQAAGGNYFRASETSELAVAIGYATGLQTPSDVLTGTVTNTQGRAVAGASVRLLNHLELREQTDANGNYQFPVTFQGIDSLIVEAAGYVRYATEVYVLGKPYDVLLHPSPDLIPVAVATAPGNVTSGTPVTLHGGESYDPGEESLVFHWDQSIANPFSVSFSHNHSSSAFAVRVVIEDRGSYAFILVVENTLGLRSAPDTVFVEASPPVLPPRTVATPVGTTHELVHIPEGPFEMGWDMSHRGVPAPRCD